LFLALLCVFAPARSMAAACVPTGVAAASIDFYGDDEVTMYINGTAITPCTNKCYKTLTTVDLLAAGVTLNLPPADNVIAAYVSDTGGNLSGVNWQLSIT